MTNLLARILLAILMPPLAVLVWVVTFLVLAGMVETDEEAAVVMATATAAVFVVAYWLLLWRRSVVWTPKRLNRTIAASLACGLAGVLAGVLLVSLSPFPDAVVGTFFGGVFGTVVWLPVTVLLWRETAAERAERIRHSAGDVVFCPRCGYNMTGLYEPRCPECGARFTLNQLYAAQQRDEIADASEERGEDGGQRLTKTTETIA